MGKQTRLTIKKNHTPQNKDLELVDFDGLEVEEIALPHPKIEEVRQVVNLIQDDKVPSQFPQRPQARQGKRSSAMENLFS